MRRTAGLVSVVILVTACSAAAPPANGPSPNPASPSTAPSSVPTEAPATLAASPTSAASGQASPDASATLTPAAPDPGVSMVATWWLDPASLPIDPQATRLHGFVLERECASGHPPEGRILAPDVDYGAEALTITYSIAPLSGDQDCQGNTPYGVVFELVEPVGGRPILDGGTVPARDATIPGS